MDIDMEQIVAGLKPFFDAIRGQFDAVNKRLDAVDRRMEEMAVRIDARFDSVEQDLYTTKTVLTRVAGDVASLKADRDELRLRSADHAETLLDHDKRLRRLEEHRA